MEEKDLKFNEKLQELVKIAKSKKSIIEDHEINDFFKDMQLEAEQFEKILETLESNNIDIFRMPEDDDEEPIIIDDDDDIERGTMKPKKEDAEEVELDLDNESDVVDFDGDSSSLLSADDDLFDFDDEF